MKRRGKIVVVVASVVTVGGLGALGLAGRGRDAVAVRVEAVVERDLVQTVTASGWIRPRSAVDVQADIMGRIIELPIEEGDTVKRGQLLLRIDPTQYEAAVLRARAAVSEAMAREAQVRAARIQAERALERARAVRATDTTLLSPQALEEAETQARVQQALHEAAQHGVQMARAALREAEDRLGKTVIRAPIDGVVTRLEVEEGEMAIVGTMNNPGSLLLTISDLSVMEAVVRVDETDVPELELGDSASIEIDAFPRRTFTGRVTQIGHSAVVPPSRSSSMGMGQSSGQAVDFEVVITLDDPPSTLRPDLSANADIVTATRDSVPAVPIIALTVRERPAAEPVPNETPGASEAASRLGADGNERDVEGVFVVREGKAHFVPVEVGIAGQEHFEVLSGLSVGDSVVAGPYEAIRTLEEGKAVRRLEQPKGGAGTATTEKAGA